MAHKGAVAAGHPETARAAEIVLAEGGNAFDAVLAAMCAATVAEPILASFGGGGFLLARPGHGAPKLFDFFVHTPKAKRPEAEIDFHPVLADFGTVTQEFHIGLGAMATPGMVKGLFAAHRALGRMPLARVVEPAVALARDGVTVNAFQAHVFDVVSAIYTATEAARSQYASPTRPDALVREGDTLKVPDFADMLDVLAREGEDLFYKGEVAQRLIADSRDGGGHLTADDMAAYEVAVRDPLTVDYGDARLYTNPPPSTGGLLIGFALEMLKGADIGACDHAGPDHVARLARVMALTNKARVDAALAEGTGDAATRMLDPRFLALYRDHVLGRPAQARGTTHISVVDAEGNAAAMTLSNGEGAAYIIPGTGVMMNNMLGEEDLNPGGFHAWTPDVRLASMMAPSLLLRRDGTEVALGSGGSNRIRTAILQVLSNMIDFDMGLESAVEAPRIHFERGVLNLEHGIDPEMAPRLAEALAEVEEVRPWAERSLFFGGVHAAQFAPQRGAFHGAGDPRRSGVAKVV